MFDITYPKKKTAVKRKYKPETHPQYENLQHPPTIIPDALQWVDRPKRPRISRRFTPFERPGATEFTYKTTPTEMFYGLFGQAENFWRKQSNKKLQELTELYNSTHEKKRKLYQISKTDSKALLAAILHMGLSKKTNWKYYWSQNENRKDCFISKICRYSKLSCRRFRTILNCIRMYDKKKATDLKLNDRNSESFDEHYKVPISFFG